jgi:hypothetical protein
MSLLIHKPAHAILTARVLRAASNLNGSCWGLMGIGEDNALLMRRHHVLDVDALVALAQALKGAEYVLHLGQNARDGARSNVYPFEVSDGLYLMHSGTLPLKTRVLTKSNTWHLVHDLLRPVAIGWRGIFTQPLAPIFQSLLEAGFAPDNKVALLDYPQRRIIVINHRHGALVDGLWLSDSRCIDRTVLPRDALAPQAHSPRLSDIRFI